MWKINKRQSEGKTEGKKMIGAGESEKRKQRNEEGGIEGKERKRKETKQMRKKGKRQETKKEEKHSAKKVACGGVIIRSRVSKGRDLFPSPRPPGVEEGGGGGGGGGQSLCPPGDSVLFTTSMICMKMMLHAGRRKWKEIRGRNIKKI